MTPNSFTLTDEEREFALEGIQCFSRLIEPGDNTRFPEVFIQNVLGAECVVVVSGGDMEGGTAEENLAAAREFLEQLQNQPDIVKKAALLYDAYLTLGDEKMSVIAVEMLGPGVTHTFAQKYVIGRSGKADLIGEPFYRVEPRSGSSPSEEHTTTSQQNI